jgi:hypothetical protein
MYQVSARISNSRMAKQEQSASREELLRHLEQASGRSLRTREDVKAYVDEVAARNAADQPSVRWWQKVKTVTLIALAAFAFVQYYAMDVMTQIMALRENTYFVPVSTPMVKSGRDPQTGVQFADEQGQGHQPPQALPRTLARQGLPAA